MGAALLLAISLSLDGFGVGLSYGLRRIRIPLGSMAIIALCTIISMGTSMLLSKWVTVILPFIPTRWLGAIILVILGGIQLFQAITEKSENESATNRPKPLHPEKPVLSSIFKIQLRSFGLVIEILKSPDLADLDCSGSISIKESILLGSALSMDAFAAGIAASLSGMPLSLIAIVALTQLAMIRLGQILTGRMIRGVIRKTKYLPGTLLILLGLGKLV